jgi:adenine-specific DNA-methyltransferase
MNKSDLINKIKTLVGITQDERAYLIDLVNTKKKYGLVWEDKPEDVEELLRENLPVLKEVKEKAIVNNEDFPNHILIEGDNLHALTTLTFTHEGKIDVIYIDPPYNTGKENEFKYNDKWVDGEDSFRHSKWLSFVYKRLKLAHRLLSNNGIMFVSIDDNEVAQLKMLLDDLFDKHNSNPKNSNSLGVLIWNLGTGTQAGHFVRSHEYVLAYCKNKALLSNFKGGDGEIEHSALKKISKKNPASDFTFPAGVRFDADEGKELSTEWGGSEKMFLRSGRMICEKGKLKDSVTLNAGWAQKTQMKQFFSGEDTYDSKGQRVVEFFFNSSGILKYRKERGVINPKTVLSDVGSTKSGSEELKSILGTDGGFDYPKSVELIKFLTGLYGDDFTVLDFFAGSGTTLQAILELNTHGGNRKCILVTNNENNICEKVTYERNKRLINGYSNSKGEQLEGLKNNNLRYFKTEFISREPSLKNKRELTKLATELLCIKEDCYQDCTSEIISNKQVWFRLFFNLKDKFFCIIYDDSEIENGVKSIQKLIELKNPITLIKVYVFSNGQYPYFEEFEEVADRVTLCALPDAIYKAYQNVLPKKKRQSVPQLEETDEIQSNSNTLFENDLYNNAN